MLPICSYCFPGKQASKAKDYWTCYMCGGENNRTTKLSLKFLPNDIPTEAESVFNQYDKRYWSNISEF